MADLSDVARIGSALDGVRATTCAGLTRWQVHGRLVARQLDRDSVVVELPHVASTDLEAALRAAWELQRR